MNVNEKGVKGLIKVIDDIQDRGMFCFTAFDDHSPVDVIALTSAGKTIRLQVKYRTRKGNSKSEKYELVAASVVNGKKIPIDRSMIDGWAVYLEEAKKVVYISCKLLEGKKSLVIDPTVNYGELDELV